MEINEEEKEKFEDAIRGLGEEDVNVEECKVKLKCFKCESKTISWFLDKDANKYLFRCHDCKTGGILTRQNYQSLIMEKQEMTF